MTGWHSRGMATISLLLLMGVTSAMLAALWYAQAQNRTQVDATQIALDRNLARQVVWQRVYNALTLASDVQPPPSRHQRATRTIGGSQAHWTQAPLSP